MTTPATDVHVERAVRVLWHVGNMLIRLGESAGRVDCELRVDVHRGPRAPHHVKAHDTVMAHGQSDNPALKVSFHGIRIAARRGGFQVIPRLRLHDVLPRVLLRLVHV